MPSEAEIEAKFWKALKSDMTVFLGLDGVEDGHARPMTSQIEGEESGPLYFFTATDNGIVQNLSQGNRAMCHFVDKGHEVWATLHGSLTLDNDRATIDRLWNPFVAAWYEGGKDDPKLALLRLDAEHAQIWLNENSVFAGIKTMLGIDPKKDYKDKVAEVSL